MAKVPPKKRSHDNKAKAAELVISDICYMPTPDAEGRLSRAIDILLRAGTNNTATSQEREEIKESSAEGK